MKTSVKKLITAVIAGLALSACGAQENQNSAAAKPQAEQSAAKAETPAGGNRLSVVRNADNSVSVSDILGSNTFTVPVKNIVSFDYASIDIIRELGGDIVGLPKAGMLPDYLSGQYSDERYINLGGLKEPLFEEINALAPGAILISARQQSISSRFKEIAPVIYTELDYTDYFNSFENKVRTLASLLGKEELAEEKLDKIEKEVDALQKRSEGKTALILLVNESKISVYGKNSRFGLIFDGFGFTPADPTIKVSTHGMTVGYEYLLEKNPDYLFVVDRTAVVTQKTGNAEKVLDNELIKRTNAFQNGNVVYLNAANWYTSIGGLASMEAMIKEINSVLD